MDKKYTKLANLVNNTFRVEKVWGYKFKRYNVNEGKMEVSDTWQEGYRKVYELDTDKGKLDLSASQLGQCLEAVFDKGKADLTNEQIYVKSNGKTGIDIRYFFNRAKPEPQDTLGGETIDISDLPI